MSIYTEHYSTLNHDTDAKGVIRPSCIQRYMQETANHQMRDCKPTYEELFADGKSFILGRIVYSCSRPLSQYERIDVQTWPSVRDRGAVFTRCYTISADGEEIVRGVGIWALVDIETKKLLRVSDCDMSNYVHAEPFEIPGLRFKVPTEELTEVGQYAVTYSLCDCNIHMNNTNYPDMFFNFVPEAKDMFVSHLSLNYKKEAPLGALLRIERSLPHINDDSITYYFRSYVGEDINSEAMMTLNSVN